MKPLLTLLLIAIVFPVVLAGERSAKSVPRSFPPDDGPVQGQPGILLGRWQGKWSVDFANGVHQDYVITGNRATVKTPIWSSVGSVESDGKSITILFKDNRAERWTPVKGRVVVEHWFPAPRIPTAPPILGIGERPK